MIEYVIYIVTELAFDLIGGFIFEILNHLAA